MAMVRWVAYGRYGRVGGGRMPASQVLPGIQKAEKKASKVLKETGADHVLYGMKIYDEENRLQIVHFYMWPMQEEEFDKLATRSRGALVYALHRR